MISYNDWGQAETEVHAEFLISGLVTYQENNLLF